MLSVTNCQATSNSFAELWVQPLDDSRFQSVLLGLTTGKHIFFTFDPPPPLPQRFSWAGQLSVDRLTSAKIQVVGLRYTSAFVLKSERARASFFVWCQDELYLKPANIIKYLFECTCGADHAQGSLEKNEAHSFRQMLTIGVMLKLSDGPGG